MSNKQAIEEAKKMIKEQSIVSTGCYKNQKVECLNELIERLEKQPEQSRYDIAMEVWNEYVFDDTYKENDFRGWLEEKNK